MGTTDFVLFSILKTLPSLTKEQREKLDSFLDARGDSTQTHLGWVRQSLGAANSANILEGVHL
jgi:hypothetical protein